MRLRTPNLRRFKAFPIPDLDREGGLSAIRGAWLNAPVTLLYGFQLMQAAEGRTVSSMPASEWFSTFDGHVSWQAIAALADMSLWTVATSVHRPGMSDVPLDSVTRFLRRATRPQKESRRVLATLLFADIVDSTGHAKRLGDTGWRDLLEEQRDAIRREVSRYNGTEVDTAGDGFFARFDSPVHAIDAACAARQATAALGIEICSGIHTGECELEGSKLAGMAVHIASRIQAAAQPGEVLVSPTVKDLTVGSGRRFENRGEQNLKGVPDPWRLYAVVD